jgi:hypothetical protein
MSTVKAVNLQHPNSSNINMVLGADGSVSGGIPAGGRNRIINGGFDVWQRGTSFSSSAIYTADRWFVAAASGQTVTVAQQSFTPGSAPVAGYEANTFARVAWSGTPTGTFWFSQRIEDVRTFAGQTVTISFWAKAASATTALSVNIEQSFGSGGSSLVNTNTPSPLSLTTSWQRFSTTVAIPSISGKTIGSGSYLEIRPFFGGSSVNGNSIDIWGVQVEAGNSPTPFEVKSYAQELRECQRYYELVGIAVATSSPAVAANILACSSFAVRKRITAGIPTRITNDYFYGAAGMATTTSSYIVTAEAIVAYRTSNGAAGQTQFSELVAVSAEL